MDGVRDGDGCLEAAMDGVRDGNEYFDAVMDAAGTVMNILRRLWTLHEWG